MQQTRLDHWLKRRLNHITRFYCNVLPEDLPREAKVEESPEGRLSSHSFRITSSSERVTETLVDLFRLQGITYAAQVDEASGLLSKLVNRPRRSLTYDVIWLIGILGLVIAGLVLIFSTGVLRGLFDLVQGWITTNMS